MSIQQKCYCRNDYAQLLLDEIASEFTIRPSSIVIVITVTQASYALGHFLLVPLVDLLNRRWLIPGQMLHPEARSRLTAAYMIFYSIGSAAGSIASTSIYAYSGWNGGVGLELGSAE